MSSLDRDRIGLQVGSWQVKLCSPRHSFGAAGETNSAGSFASRGVNVLPSRKVPCFLISAGLIALPMASRTRLLITVAVLCHLLLAPRLVTSQLHPTSSEHQNLPEAPHGSSQPVTIQALQQEKDGPVYKLRGNAKIDYETYTFSADEGHLQLRFRRSPGRRSPAARGRAQRRAHPGLAWQIQIEDRERQV